MTADPAPDLAALRSMCRIRLCGRGPNESRVEAYAAAGNWLANRPDQILAVLALVNTLQADNERLRDALTRIVCADYPLDGFSIAVEALDYDPVAALSVPPAEKEPPCPACGGKGEVVDGIDQHGGDSFWTCMRCGGSGQEPS